MVVSKNMLICVSLWTILDYFHSCYIVL
jgi:hypothetical protein